MSHLVRTLAAYGDQLMYGVTVLLGCGFLAVYFVRKPVNRQRLGEICVGSTFLWMAVALVPMHRITFDWLVDFRRQPNDLARLWVLPAANPDEAADKSWTVDGAKGIPGTRAVSSHDTDDTWLPTSAVLPTSVASWPSSQPILPVREVFSRIYLGGALATSFWLLFGRLSLWIAERRASQPSSWLTELYESLDRGRAARVLVTKRGQPISFGTRSPRIMLPAAICRPDNSAALHYVLRHEQVHIDRRDAWGHIVLNMAMPFLYFHPLYWWIRSQVTFCRELIADDRACEPHTKAAYVESLLSVLRQSTLPGVRRPAGSLGVFRSPFLRRMKMLVDRSEPLKSHTTKRWMVCAFVSTLLGVAAVASVFGVEKPPRAHQVQAEPTAAVSSASAFPGAVFDDSDAKSSLDPPRPSEPEMAIPTDADPPNSAALGHPHRVPSIIPPAPSAAARSTAEFVIAAHETDMAFSTSGIVNSIAIEEGDEVTHGQLIARLDDEEATHRVNLAVNNYEMAKSRAESKIRSSIANKSLELSQLDYNQAIEANQRQPGTVSDSQLRALRHELDKSAFELAQAREDASLSAKDALAKYELVKIAQKMLAARRLVARSEGIITKIHRNPGSFVSEGDTICTVVPMQRLFIEGQIPMGLLSPQGRIQPNLFVTIYPGHQGEGIVTTANVISTAQPDGERTIRFRAWIENSRHNGGWLIAPGMRAVVRFSEFPSVPASPVDNIAKSPTSINSDLLWGGLPSSAAGRAEVVAAMQEMVEFAEENLARVRTRSLGGIPGGEAVYLGAARYFLHHAKGQLAVARQDAREARQQMESAVEATADWFAAAQASHALGDMDIAELQRAAAARATAKYWLAAFDDLVDE